MLKHFRITMTINVFVDAENEDAAQEIAQDMEISFKDGEKELEQNLIDWEVSEVKN